MESFGQARVMERPVDPRQVQRLTHLTGCSVMARVYAGRGVQEDELDWDLSRIPPPGGLPGIGPAVALLEMALREQRRILVVADFDADGATSCALAVRALLAMGGQDVSYLVPNRFEYGYGLTPEIVSLALQSEPELLITVDNGITSSEGVQAAQRAGVRVLVTDHHLPGERLPEADAIVNPKLGADGRYQNLAGVGVIFLVMVALRARLREEGWFGQDITEPNLASLLDLVALGTVADVVPLDYTNRLLVRQGLSRINKARACNGIQQLLRVANREPGYLRAADLGFAVGPRLNAAGRLEDMSLGIACLLAKHDGEAAALARHLDELNQARRTLESDMVEQAESLLDQIPQGDEDTLVHCLFHEQWHQGVIGILAARIREKTGRPVIAFAPGESRGELKGSGRSIPGLHMRDALVAVAARCPGLLDKFGGHAMAAGLTLPRSELARFSGALEEAVSELLGGQLPGAVTETDGVLDAGQLDDPDACLLLARRLEDGGPWGAGFPPPRFRGTFVLREKRVVGERHLKMQLLSEGGRAMDAISFNQGDFAGTLPQKIDIIYSFIINRYYKKPKVELEVHALGFSD